jgi:hypothetical protein
VADHQGSWHQSTVSKGSVMTVPGTTRTCRHVRVAVAMGWKAEVARIGPNRRE